MSYSFEVAALSTVSDYDGGAKALGAVVDINGSVLSHKVCLTDKANHLTVPQARKIMQATGDYRMLHGLATDLDHICIQVSSVGNGNRMFRSISDAAREFGDFLGAVTASVEDGNVTPNELRRIDRELAQMIVAANQLRSLCAATKSKR
ncbi:MAG TPA: hypothetical protein DIS96_11640 [Pusillimonas sp.]|nr:hypothetical protein [Pusillimonas sp.]